MAIVQPLLVGDNREELEKKNKKKQKARVVRDGMLTWLRPGREKKGDKQFKAGHYCGTKGQRDREGERENLGAFGSFLLLHSSSHLDQVTSFTSFFSPNSASLDLGPKPPFFFFLPSLPACFRLCLKALDAFLLDCEHHGTSLLARMDILTGDRLWPLAYRNRGRVQPGVL